MYIFIFYTLLISIFFSLFVKLNPDFLEKFSKNFFGDEKKISLDEDSRLHGNDIASGGEEKKIKKEEKKSFEDFEKRWDFYAEKNFIELAINEYNKSILEIKKLEEKNRNPEKFLEEKTRIFEKLYKNENLIWDYKKAEKNILNLVSVSSDEKYLFYLVQNKINQKDLKKAKLILDRVKAKNYKFYYYDFILNLDINVGLEELEKKSKNLKYLTDKSWDTNFKSKVFVLNNAIEEFKTYRDSKNIHLYTLIWKALTNSFEFEVSNKILWEVLKKREDYRDARIVFAYNKIRQWETEKWLNILIWAEDIDSTKPEIQFYKAIAYQDLNNSIKAKHNYLIALKNWYEPRSQIYQKLAEIYFKEWDFSQSIEFYKKMLSVNSEDVNYFLLPFKIAVENQKDYVLALRIAQWANRRHPKSALAKSILWYWYFLNWDLETAKNELKKSFELDNV